MSGWSVWHPQVKEGFFLLRPSGGMRLEDVRGAAGGLVRFLEVCLVSHLFIHVCYVLLIMQVF